ncbi:Astacin (Peptidase M12A) [Branchiostoma belcheri]|nr:Astacin (Peptidase M12A) [Branchiostoma belcheri]
MAGRCTSEFCRWMVLVLIATTTKEVAGQGKGDPVHGSGRVAMDNIIEINKGLHLFEADIKYYGPSNTRNAIKDSARLWDYKEIPFVIRQGDYCKSMLCSQC